MGGKVYSGKCEYCGIDYRGSSRKYCSPKCYCESRKTTIHCQVCGKEMRISISLFRRGKKFCSQECARLGVTKNKSVYFNGNKYTETEQGYFRHRKCASSATYLHHDVWVFYNGPVTNGYVIHHIDENKENNDISNLEMLSRPDHVRLHDQNRNRSIDGTFQRGIRE
jgi:hypothetical protein